MEMLGLRILMQRDQNKSKLELVVPDWIAAKMGELLIVEYDGFRLSVWPAES
jgi:hypothetical protein